MSITVSVQRVGTESATERHVAWGALVTPDLVVAHNPMDWLDESLSNFEILIADVCGDRASRFERIRIKRIEILGLENAPNDAVALINLSHEASFDAASTSTDPSSLAEQLESTSDVWLALEAAGAFSPGLRERIPREVLAPIDRLVGQIDDLLITRRLLPTGDSVASWWCFISPRCMCRE